MSITEDSDNNNLQIISAGVANAEQVMGEASDSNFIPNIGPSTGDIPNRLIAQTSRVVFHRWMQPIDITDGNWKTLPIWYDAALDWATGKLTDRPVGNIFDLSMYTIMGGVHQSLGNPYDTTDAVATMDQNEMLHYTHGRLKNIGIHLKNFLVQVERDTSGGVQWKDEPVFEIQLFPVSNYLPSESSITSAAPAYCYTTTLKEGYKAGCSFTCGVFEKAHSIAATLNINNVTYYTYPSIGEWLCDEMPHPANLPSLYYRGNPQVHGLAYHAYIRLVNIPRGLSNIKVDLSYSAELIANWDSYGHLVFGTINMDVDGDIVGARLSNMLKRAIETVEQDKPSEAEKRTIQRYRRMLTSTATTSKAGLMDIEQTWS